VSFLRHKLNEQIAPWYSAQDRVGMSFIVRDKEMVDTGISIDNSQRVDRLSLHEKKLGELTMRNVSVREVLDVICERVQTQWRLQETNILIFPKTVK